MHRFEEAPDAWAERVSDEELREILTRLGEAEFHADDRSTVGAIVEATGTDPAVVLRMLGEIRNRALEDGRRAVESIERRLRSLETRPTPAPRVFVEPQKKTPPIPVAGIVVAALVLFLGLLALAPKAPQGGYPSTVYGEVTTVMRVDDGEVRLSRNGSAEVVRSDGTTREATEKEKADAKVFALQHDVYR